MCGIAGVAWADRRRPGEAALVEEMAAALRHRGPDGKGVHVGPGIGLGIRRLAIIDLATGEQPIANEDGTVAVICNGEIYNHAALRAELTARGHRFRSRSDVEVIVHLYEELGIESVRRLRGMFAFALWDAARRRLWLVRDRLGIKPLHYALTAEGLYFGSEIKAILAADLETRALDVRALDDLFTLGFVPDPRTLLRSVRRLGAGHWLLYEGGRVTLHPYWRFGDVMPGDRGSAGVWAERLRDKLEETVRLYLHADVPVGAWLSGGLDSSAVVSLARGIVGPLPTFTLAFDDAAYDETRGQRTLDRVPGQELPNERIRCDSRILERYPQALWHAETPSGGVLDLLRLMLAEGAARRVKVVLTGEGADEVLGGYRWYLIDRLFRPLGALPVPLRHAVLLAPLGSARRSFARRLVLGPQSMGLERYARLTGPLGGRRRHPVFSAEIQHQLGEADDADGRSEPVELDGRDPFLQLQQLDVTLRLPAYINHTLDAASMAFGLEARVPFLDHELVELCAGIPSSLKLRGLREKYVLRQALEGVLPRDIQWRRKRPLLAPVEAWLRAPLPAFAEELLAPARLHATGYFEPAAVQSLITEVRAGRSLGARVLLMVLGVQLWDALFRTRTHERPGTPRGAP